MKLRASFVLEIKSRFLTREDLFANAKCLFASRMKLVSRNKIENRSYLAASYSATFHVNMKLNYRNTNLIEILISIVSLRNYPLFYLIFLDRDYLSWESNTVIF